MLKQNQPFQKAIASVNQSQIREGPVPETPLYLDRSTWQILLALQGPSLGLWRAAEIAILREQIYQYPIVDLGCGDGLVTSLVLQNVDIGLDPDEKQLTQARSRDIYNYLIPLPVENASIPPESIGTVISNSVLEHILDLDIVLEAVVRMLKPEGKLIFTVPTASFSEWLALPIASYAHWRNQQLCHLNLWSVEEWTQTLARVGLEIEIVRFYLERELVSIWDTLELLQQIQIGQRRLFGTLWRQLPTSLLDRLATQASHLDLSSSSGGGGQLIVAKKR